MYAVNASIPKTLVRHLVDYVARDNLQKDQDLTHVLEDILDRRAAPMRSASRTALFFVRSVVPKQGMVIAMISLAGRWSIPIARAVMTARKITPFCWRSAWGLPYGQSPSARHSGERRQAPPLAAQPLHVDV